MNFYDKLYLLAVDTKIEDALKEAGPPKGGRPSRPEPGMSAKEWANQPHAAAAPERGRRRPSGIGAALRRLFSRKPKPPASGFRGMWAPAPKIGKRNTLNLQSPLETRLPSSA